MFCVGISVAGTSVAAEPLASDNDSPAAPNNGTAHARLFCFEACFARDMVESSIPSGKFLTNLLARVPLSYSWEYRLTSGLLSQLDWQRSADFSLATMLTVSVFSNTHSGTSGQRLCIIPKTRQCASSTLHPLALRSLAKHSRVASAVASASGSSPSAGSRLAICPRMAVPWLDRLVPSARQHQALALFCVWCRSFPHKSRASIMACSYLR